MANVYLEAAPEKIKINKISGLPSRILNTPEKKDPESPATTSLAYDVMSPRWAKIEALLGGTETMREAAEMYLPRHAEESNTVYMERLARSTLYNLTELTLESWVGRPFSEPMKVSEQLPDQIKQLLDDIDLQDNDINVFARNWFRNGIAKGLSHVFVDFPRRPETAQPRTLEDDRKDKLRPYFVHITPENLIFAHAETVNGQEILTHIRIKETVVEQVGYAEVVKQRIKVITIGNVDVFEYQKIKGKDKWVRVESYTYDLPFIPLITFYSQKEDFMVSKPPLTDLADLNIAHWQSNSDQTAVLTVSRFPILALSGTGNATDDQAPDLTIGPNKWLYCPDPAGKYYYVEHSGSSIEAGRQHLKDLEEAMSNYGAEFLKKRPGRETASARILETSESTSPLQDMVIRFTDALNTALYVMGQWLKVEVVDAVKINTEFAEDLSNMENINALTQMRTNRDISRLSLINEMKRRNILPENFDANKDQEQLEQEALDMTANPDATLDLDPNQ